MICIIKNIDSIMEKQHHEMLWHSAKMQTSSTAIFNSTALTLDDELRPPLYFPTLVRGQPVPRLLQPPASAPRTVRDFEVLSGSALTDVEEYYHVGHEGDVSERLGRLRKLYGMRIESGEAHSESE
jgi:hypothetical protein